MSTECLRSLCESIFARAEHLGSSRLRRMCDRACIYRIYRIGAELEFVGFRLRIL